MGVVVREDKSPCLAEHRTQAEAKPIEELKMQVHHNPHMTWISALTHCACSCSAGQGHTITEELLLQDMMVL
ncbi:hypothetical protein NQZ68_004425 [Dissostichus eleginoides]|nr:hypothetical protein NQZ68_004425 [Dissostichus eleginoides]